MPETMDQTRRRLITNGWFHKLYKPGTGDAACSKCGYLTNHNGECLCHEADRHMTSIAIFLEEMGLEKELNRHKGRAMSRWREENGQPVYTLAVVGSRDFTNALLIENALRGYLIDHPNLRIVSGGASGADSIAASFALNKWLLLTEYLPDWKAHGNAAGPIRNRQIIADADELVGFWDGASRGTKSSLEFAKAKGIKATVFTDDGREYVYCEGRGDDGNN